MRGPVDFEYAPYALGRQAVEHPRYLGKGITIAYVLSHEAGYSTFTRNLSTPMAKANIPRER